VASPVTLARNPLQTRRGEGRDWIHWPDVRSAVLQYFVGGARELYLGVARREAEAERWR